MTDLVDAWQAALAAEQQAVFGYGLLGPQLAGSDRDLAQACAGEHQALRDATATAIVAAGHTPVAPLPDYPSLYPVPGPAAARRLALRLEEAGGQAWRYLFLSAGPDRTLRETAQQNLTASAVRAVRWRELITPRRPTTPFPGL